MNEEQAVLVREIVKAHPLVRGAKLNVFLLRDDGVDCDIILNHIHRYPETHGLAVVQLSFNGYWLFNRDNGERRDDWPLKVNTEVEKALQKHAAILGL